VCAYAFLCGPPILFHVQNLPRLEIHTEPEGTAFTCLGGRTGGRKEVTVVRGQKRRNR
jgi:hypothetical protein